MLFQVFMLFTLCYPKFLDNNNKIPHIVIFLQNITMGTNFEEIETFVTFRDTLKKAVVDRIYNQVWRVKFDLHGFNDATMQEGKDES